jgi:signal transduction histidine kinase
MKPILTLIVSFLYFFSFSQIAKDRNTDEVFINYVYNKRPGNYENALLYLEKKKEREGFHFNYKNQAEIKKFQEKLKVAEKDTQLAQLKTNKKLLTIGLIIIANFLIIGMVLFFIYFRRKGKQLKKVQTDLQNLKENEIHKINYARDQAISGLRKQFSTQLHNDVGSILIATSSFLKSKKKLENNEEDKNLWDDISEELQKVYNIVRKESHQIYDASFDNTQFLADLDKNIRVIFSGQSIDLHTKISIEKDKNLTPEIKLCILSTIREACTNILKYAKAKNVSIDLTNDDENIYLEISNDSRKRSPKTKQVSLGIGLINLNEQIKTLNGVFTANHTEDGFAISAEIPLK